MIGYFDREVLNKHMHSAWERAAVSGQNPKYWIYFNVGLLGSFFFFFSIETDAAYNDLLISIHSRMAFTLGALTN